MSVIGRSRGSSSMLTSTQRVQSLHQISPRVQALREATADCGRRNLRAVSVMRAALTQAEGYRTASTRLAVGRL